MAVAVKCIRLGDGCVIDAVCPGAARVYVNAVYAVDELPKGKLRGEDVTKVVDG